MDSNHKRSFVVLENSQKKLKQLLLEKLELEKHYMVILDKK